MEKHRISPSKGSVGVETPTPQSNAPESAPANAAGPSLDPPREQQLDLLGVPMPPARPGPVRGVRSRVSQYDILESNMTKTAEHAVFRLSRVTLDYFLKCANRCFKSALTNKRTQVDAMDAMRTTDTQKGSIDPD